MIDLKSKEGKLEAGIAAALCCGVTAFGFYRMRYGVYFGDEGHMVSSPWRYALGDAPFRDEAMNPLRWFDLLMWPLMRALPEHAGLLWLRAAGFIANILCFGALLSALRRHLPVIALAGVYAAAIYSNFWTMWTPTYHTASAGFFFLSAAFWISGIETRGRRRAALMGTASGVMFFLSVFCELPNAALLAAPAGAAALSLRSRAGKEGLLISSACIVGVVCALMIAAVSALALSGLAPELVEAFKIQYSFKAYKTGFTRLPGLLHSLRLAAPYCAAHAGAWFAVYGLFELARRPGGRGRLYFAAGVAAGLVYIAGSAWFVIRSFEPELFVLRGFGTMPLRVADFMEGLILFAMASYPLHAASLRAMGGSSALRPVLSILFWFGAAWHFLMAMTCASGLIAATLITFPIHFVLLVLIAHERWSAAARAVGRPGALFANLTQSAPTLALCAAVCAAAVSANLFEVDSFGWFWNYDTAFKTEKLLGIYHKKNIAAGTDAVVEYLAPRMKSGDFLLAFYDNPMLHYLTNTRAALRTGYVSRNYSEDLRRRFLAEMVERGRTPQYVVSYGPVYDEPVYAYVVRHYRPVVLYGGLYAIWEKH